MTGVIVFIGHRPVAGNCRPQTGQVDAFDGPEKHKAALVDIRERPGLGRKRLGGRKMKSSQAMCIESFQVDDGHAAILAHEGLICKQTL